MIKCLFAILLVLNVSCANRILISPHEECALQGMKLEGVYSGSNVGTAYNYHTGSTVLRSESSGVNCSVTKDEAELKEIEKTNKYLEPIVNYNSSVSDKRIINGIAYFLYIVPGIILKVVFDGQKSNAIDEAKSLKSELEK